jgi:hypothetical protein
MKHQATNADINSQELQNLKLINRMGQSFSRAPLEYQILRWLALPNSMQLPAELNIG